MDQALINIRWCSELLNGLVSAGVSEVVISPGSRSTPLVLAADRHPVLHCQVLVDERSAAFFALGMAKCTGMPVALVCTSGSAAANWYPAVVEASHASVPLILLTADRPWELQNCGANQTIDQVKMFASQVRAFHPLSEAEDSPAALHRLSNLGRQAAGESLWPDAGPVHINVPLREPLVPSRGMPTDDMSIPHDVAPRPMHNASILASAEQLAELVDGLSGRRGLIVCGPQAHDTEFAGALTRLATHLDCPILADPLAGLRFGKHERQRILCHYSLFLAANEMTQKPDWVLRFGDLPVSSTLQRYITLSDSLHIVVEPRARWSDPLNQTALLVRASPTVVCRQLNESPLQAAPADWCKAWLEADNRVEQLLAQQPAIPVEAQMMQQLVCGLSPDSLLFSANSTSIRYLDSYSGKAAGRLQIACNRGASGIDGNVSTFLGLVAAYTGQGKCVAVIGDLAFFHDMNGLAAAVGLDAVIIVLNNNGGGIFEQLPQRSLAGYEKYWRTPQQLDFAHTARLYGLSYRLIPDMHRFGEMLRVAHAEQGVSLLEISTDPAESLCLQQAFIQRIDG